MCAGSVIALGMFDGVHIGHRELIRTSLRVAAETGCRPIAFTFLNHPAELFGPLPRLLTTSEERISTLKSLGIDVEAVRFDAAMADTPPADFAAMLVNEYGMKHAVMGFNYSFGAKGAGNAETMRELGSTLGFESSIVLPVKLNGITVSSSIIRKLIESGNLEEANVLLGAPYAITSHIVGSRKIGRSIGFPTANFRDISGKVLPRSGVYVTLAGMDGKTMQAITNVGNNPTVGGMETTVETHILNFSGDIYGKTLRVEFLKRLRDDRRFPSVPDLAAQINEDVRCAREYFALRVAK